MIRKAVNKTQLAKSLGISRSSLYYQPQREKIDEEVKHQIESVLAGHPAYGHKRIALHLKLNKKRILRVMNKYGIKPYRRKVKRQIKKKDQGREKAEYVNLLKTVKVEKPNQVWATDFTYIKFQGRFIYLATVIDVFTREIVGVNIARFHNRFLVVGAMEDALKTRPPPEIIHSDQGSEYDSEDFTQFVKMIEVQISMSEKGSPWQNGFQESFYGHLKEEAGDLNRFETLGEFIEELYQMIYYYNYQRIHTSLKMTPVQFKLQFLENLTESSSK